MMPLARLVLLGVLLASAVSSAATPGRLHVNGMLSDTNDRPLNGIHSLKFSLYTQREEGVAFFVETLDVQMSKGAFFVELGTTTPLDLDLFADNIAGVWLGITVGSGAELSPRLRMGEVPFAAFAHRAGNAVRAEDALFFGGRDLSDFRLVSDAVPFSQLSGVPAGLADGDDDTKYTGANFALSNQTCPAGQVMRGVTATGTPNCVADQNTTYSGANFALSDQTCPAGQVMRGVTNTGALNCVADVDTNTTYSGANFALSNQTCPADQVMRGVTNTGAPNCVADQNTTYSGTNFARSNQTCPTGSFMTGVNSSGTITCSSTTVIRDYVNQNCSLYVGWQDSCNDTCAAVTYWTKVNGTGSSCSGSIGCATFAPPGGFGSRAYGRLRFAGDVGGDDRLFFAFQCS